MKQLAIGVLTIVSILLVSVLFATAADQPPRIMVDEVKAKMDSGQKVVFIDTRTGSSWSSSNQMIPGALRVRGNQEFKAILETLDKDTFIVTYCT